MSPMPTFDPTRDLVLTRVVDVPRDLVWRAWTEPEQLKQWFCPKPWNTTHCEIDLSPGGRFRTVMEGPNGERSDSTGCYLEVVAGRRLVFTSVLGPGFRPLEQAEGGLAFTAVITLEDDGQGTRYTATAMHPTAAGRQAHEAMGFHQGWGAALDQLVEMAKRQLSSRA
jgi:uncharacterized protein YndB with AHSA1/START domain